LDPEEKLVTVDLLDQKVPRVLQDPLEIEEK
jgi:hypothetical protein